MISYLLPTYNRPQTLLRTLRAIGALDALQHEAIGGAEVIVIDNASNPPAPCPNALANGFPVRVLRMDRNVGAAARNMGAEHAQGEWLVMLDDDSYPLDCGHLHVLLEASEDVTAIGAEIVLESGEREAGGLPEVIIGCGAAIRKTAFEAVGGYDASFDYYAEEYDLCAKMLLAGFAVEHSRSFRVQHMKEKQGRDMDRILHRLVRNNVWVAQRYAPDRLCDREIADIISRYAGIAVKEGASCGFACGMQQLTETAEPQPRREMPADLWDRFTGLHHVRQWLAQEIGTARRVAIVDHGKNAWAIEKAIDELGMNLVDHPSQAELVVIGTLSPGPMLDAADRWRARVSPGCRVLTPWLFEASLREQAVSVQNCNVCKRRPHLRHDKIAPIIRCGR